MIYVNSLDKKDKISQEEFRTLILLLAPFAPHITEELWLLLGRKDSIHIQNWPTYDSKKLIKDEIILNVQINGKIRANLSISRNQSEADLKKRVLMLPEVHKWLNGKEPKKIIIVPGKIISIVT